MKTTMTILAATLVCVALGCEKKSEPPPEAAEYDPEIDGPPHLLAPEADEDILADQTRATGRPAPTVPIAPTPAGVDPVEEVKQHLAAVLTEAKRGRTDGIAELFPTPMVSGMRAMLVRPEKLKAFEQLVKDKLGMEVPDMIKSGPMGSGSGPGPGGPPLGPTGSLQDVSVDDLKFARRGANVVATDPKGNETVFAKTPRGWKIQVPPEAQAFMSIVSELAEGTVTVIDALTAGINDGSVTKDNFEAKADELGQQHLKAPTERFAKVFGEMMKKAMEAGPMAGPVTPGPTPVPTTPTVAPTPTPPVPAAASGVPAVRRQLSEAMDGLKAGNVEPFANLFSEPTAGTFRKLLALKTKTDALKKLVGKKFGRFGLRMLKAPFDQAAGLAKKIPATPVAKLTFAQDGANVVVSTKDGEKALIFASTPQGWKATPAAGQEELSKEDTDVVDRLDKLFDELTAGINDGSVQTDGLDQKVTELLIKHKLLSTQREPRRREAF